MIFSAATSGDCGSRFTATRPKAYSTAGSISGTALTLFMGSRAFQKYSSMMLASPMVRALKKDSCWNWFQAATPAGNTTLSTVGAVAGRSKGTSLPLEDPRPRLGGWR
jgi:hypothetical protein